MQDPNWNPNDWQGRRRDQVESNNTVAMLGTGMLILMLILAIISALSGF